MFIQKAIFQGKNIFLEIFDEFGTLGTAIMLNVVFDVDEKIIFRATWDRFGTDTTAV